MVQALLASEDVAPVPRSRGHLNLSTKAVEGGTGIDRFRTSGSTKVAFPRRQGALEAIMLNTSGGLTGGDRFDADASAGPDSHLVLTTQAAERAYRSQSGAAHVTTRLFAAQGATLHWLPQELIVFDGASIERCLTIDLHAEAEAVIVEPVVVGRSAMGETRVAGAFLDRITLLRDGAPLYRDRIKLTGPISAHLDRPAVAFGMSAFATALYAGPRAEALLPKVRKHLPTTGGASIVAPNLLVIRLVAGDAYLLRRSLLPVLECLTNASLPKSWSL